MRCRDDKIIWVPKDWFELLQTFHPFEQSSYEQESTQNTAIHILILKSALLDIDEFSYDEVLSLLLTSIYIFRLAPTRNKAYRLNKVSICIVDI